MNISRWINNPFLFWLFSFLYFSVVTIAIFHHRIENISTEYAMPDIDTDGGMWYQWYQVYIDQHDYLYYITSLIVYPFGFDLTFLPFSNLIYSIHIFILKYILGFSWSNLVLVTNVSSLITYPLSALGGALLSNYLIKSRWISLIVGLIFSFSFYHVHMARGQMSINHIEIIPFYFLSLFYFLNKKNIFSLILSTLTFAILFNADAYYAFFSGIFSVIVILLYKPESFIKKVKSFLFYYLTLFLVLVLINFNFFLSNLYLFDHAQAVATGRNSIPKNELVNVLYYFIPQPFSYIRTYFPAISYLLFILIPLIAISGLVFFKKNRLYITLLACLLVAMILSTYIPYLYWLNELYFRFFGMFRGVARMILPAYLFLGLLVGLTLVGFTKSKIYKTIDKKIIYLSYVAFTLIILLNALNVDQTWWRKTNFSKIAKLYEPIKNNDQIKVIASYPMTQNDVITGCPETYQLVAQIIHNKSFACGLSPFQPETLSHYKKISNISDKNTIDYLTKHNIDTIIISNKLIKNSEKVNKSLINDPRIKFVGRYTETPDKGYTSTTDRARDISVYQLKEVVENNKKPKSLFFSNNKNVKVSNKKVSSAKYLLTIENIQHESLIIFDSPFSEKWQMHIGDFSKDNDVLFNFKKEYIYDNHIRFNEYANAWLIKPNKIKNEFPESYTENSNKSINIKATIYFAPQSTFYAGSLISAVTFLLLTIYLIIKFVYDRFKK